MERYDKENGYCRMLGHYIPFKYCRTQQDGLPCARILDCYFERFPIQEYINLHYTRQEQAQIFKQQAPKLHSLIALIEKAKERTA